jgi:hypothetical protein
LYGKGICVLQDLAATISSVAEMKKVSGLNYPTGYEVTRYLRTIAKNLYSTLRVFKSHSVFVLILACSAKGERVKTVRPPIRAHILETEADCIIYLLGIREWLIINSKYV